MEVRTFEEAVKFIADKKKMPEKKIDIDSRRSLVLYGLYKQIKAGDCTTPEPSNAEKRKWSRLQYGNKCKGTYFRCGVHINQLSLHLLVLRMSFAAQVNRRSSARKLMSRSLTINCAITFPKL